MKLNEVIFESHGRGTYAGVRFSDRTNKAIAQYCEDNEISNSVDPSKLHCTLLYSRKHCPNYKPHGKYEKPMIGIPEGIELWKPGINEGYGDGSNTILVLKFFCPELEDRHHELMSTHDATYDYPEFKTHTTMSYDVGNNLAINQLPDFMDPVEIIEEYGEDLEPGNFANDSGDS